MLMSKSCFCETILSCAMPGTWRTHQTENNYNNNSKKKKKKKWRGRRTGAVGRINGQPQPNRREREKVEWWKSSFVVVCSFGRFGVCVKKVTFTFGPYWNWNDVVSLWFQTPFWFDSSNSGRSVAGTKKWPKNKKPKRPTDKKNSTNSGLSSKEVSDQNDVKTLNFQIY